MARIFEPFSIFIQPGHEILGAGGSHRSAHRELLDNRSYAVLSAMRAHMLTYICDTQSSGYGSVDENDGLHFVELCAGSARLTEVHREFGYATLPMDVTLA